MPRRPRVLIVDDDVDFVESLRPVLESRSYDIISASSSDDGIRQVEHSRPDLILLDIMMPEGTEGFHFVWSLRKHRKTTLREIPIIVVTSIHNTTELRLYPDQHDTDYQPGEFLPVQAFLDKPLKPAALLEQVDRTLSEKWKRS